MRLYHICNENRSIIQELASHFKLYIEKRLDSLLGEFESKKLSPMTFVEQMIALYKELNGMNQRLFVNAQHCIDLELERTLNNTVRYFLSQKCNKFPDFLAKFCDTHLQKKSEKS